MLPKANLILTMIKVGLHSDIEFFLEKFFTFKKVGSPLKGYLALEGKISVIDKKNRFWEQFGVCILINEVEYPYTVPIVIEKTQKIKRDWEYHISINGECCLDIPHKLLKLKKRGIIIEEFYYEVIYPFFANYCYRESAGRYANGEYKHHFEGIAQFYQEEFHLEDIETIIALLETSINVIKYQPNRACPFCGKPKYKTCCRKIIYKLREFGLNRLNLDLELFKDHLLKKDLQILNT